MVANAAPDGYTVLVAENAIGINQALYKKHQSGFDPLKQYDAVAAMGSTPLVLERRQQRAGQQLRRTSSPGRRRVPGKYQLRAAPGPAACRIW